jgi:hypothetical protein
MIHDVRIGRKAMVVCSIVRIQNLRTLPYVSAWQVEPHLGPEISGLAPMFGGVSSTRALRQRNRICAGSP